MVGRLTCLRQGKLRVESLARASEVLQRLRIVEVLERVEQMPVHVLVQETGFAQAVVSHHLSQMRRVGLVASERRGKEMWYTICDPRVLSILNCICTHCTEGDYE